MLTLQYSHFFFVIFLCSALFSISCTPKQQQDSLADTQAFSELDDPSVKIPSHDEIEALLQRFSILNITLSEAERIALYDTKDLDISVNLEETEHLVTYFTFLLYNGRKTMEYSLVRGEPYFKYIQEVFQEYNIPEEIAYLAFVESGYKPIAVSRVGATGLWQFMPATGKAFKLRQDWWIDERQDPYKSTRAAAEYLSQLYERFGDWHLAMAAYNAGEGKISRALNNSEATTFFGLCEASLNEELDERLRLKQETQQYVPRIIAVAKIMRHLDALGFKAPEMEKHESVIALTAKPGTDLLALSQHLKINWKEFALLNPAFKRYVTPPQYETTVYVPQSQQDSAQAFLNKPGSNRFAGWQVYTVQKGDTLYAISNKVGVPLSVIQQANKVQRHLSVGQKIMIPTQPNSTIAVASANTAQGKPKPAPKPNQKPGQTSKNNRTHVVKQGDTLFAIARTNSTTVKNIQIANNMTGAKLKIGQQLIIPKGN